MPSPETDPVVPPDLVQTCLNCAALVDVSEQDPFEVVHCPMCGTAMRVERRFNNFALLEALGHGGMGTVYRAVDTNLNREVALKVLRKDYSNNPEFVQKLEREAKITASINHPHVVKVYSSGTANGQFYIAMECVDRGSLDDLMQLQKRVAEIQALDVGIQIAEGLAAAYQRGLIHSDVKPGNILFADAHTAKIVDFGLATLLEDEAGAKGEVWGTPYYVSPERLNREPEDFRSDMYSLGATLFHAIAGRPPFEDETASLVALRHIRSRAVSLQAFAPDVSSETAYVVNRMLKKEPAERYGSYEELVQHLRYARAKVEEGVTVPRQRARVVVEDEESQRVTGWISLAMLGLVLVVGLVLVLNWNRIRGKEKAPAAGGGGRPTPVATGGDPVRDAYEEGRRLLVSGDTVGALARLESAQRSGPLPQPLRNWVTAHRGLAMLLAGDQRAAQAAFKSLADAGPYSKDPSELPLAQFFVDLGKLVADDKGVLKAAAKIYDKGNFEAFALLALGLKNWNLGSFEDGAALLEEYVAAEPKPPYDWIANYKPAARRFLQDYRLYRGVREAVDAAKDPRGVQFAQARVRDARMNVVTRGRLAQELEAIEGRLKGGKSAATPAPAASPGKAAAPASGGGSDKGPESFQKALQSYRQKVPLMQFASLEKELAGFSGGDAEAQRLGSALRRKAGWLSDFKEMLIGDIASGGYAKPVTRRNGALISGGVTKASDERIEVKLPYGTAPIAWGDISVQTVIDMARGYLEKAKGGDRAERLWLLGVFAYEMGRADEGRKLLLEAVQASDVHKEDLELFFATASAGE